MYSLIKYFKQDDDYIEINRIENLPPKEYLEMSLTFLSCEKKVDEGKIIGIKKENNILEIIVRS